MTISCLALKFYYFPQHNVPLMSELHLTNRSRLPPVSWDNVYFIKMAQLGKNTHREMPRRF